MGLRGLRQICSDGTLPSCESIQENESLRASLGGVSVRFRAGAVFSEGNVVVTRTQGGAKDRRWRYGRPDERVQRNQCQPCLRH